MPAYLYGATLTPGTFTPNTDEADADSLRYDCEFEFAYPCGQWALVVPPPAAPQCIGDALLEAVVARLRAVPVIADEAGAYLVGSIRRTHLTTVARSDCPRIHVIDGAEKPVNVRDCTRRTYAFTVAVFLRPDDDDVFAALDPYKRAILAALDPGP